MALVIRDDSDGCCTLTLNRPDVNNALSTALLKELRDHVEALSADADTGCVILRGAGASFCGGFDLKGGKAKDLGLPADFNVQTIESLAALPQPVIAAVRGHCSTGGLELAMTADVIVASETARFADLHAKLGLNARWGLSQRLPRRIGAAAAKMMMLAAVPVKAAEALHLGLAQQVVPDEELEAAAEALARRILAANPASVRRAKRMIDQGLEAPLDQALKADLATHPGLLAEQAEA